MAEIPAALIDAIREQRAVLFLSAGASYDAKHSGGGSIPIGNEFHDAISDKFLGGELKHKTLSSVAAMAANEAGLAAFQRFVRDLFAPFEPADFHSLIPSLMSQNLFRRGKLTEAHQRSFIDPEQGHAGAAVC
jgi:hypothetical protein